MLEEIQLKLETEILNLTHELNVDLPERIKIAMEHGDLRENRASGRATSVHGGRARHTAPAAREQGRVGQVR